MMKKFLPALLLCLLCALLLPGRPARAAEDVPDVVTLTFHISGYPTTAIDVQRGQYPAEVPEIPELPAASILGWYDENGNLVDPAALPAERNAAYTARWGREVSQLLQTDEHVVYVQGYKGLFRPERNVTRAEAAQMLYSLLREQDCERKSFTDVEDQWYAKAVETMGGLGVIRGLPNGSFQPERGITRAEFVTMAVACDTLLDKTASFPDVSKNFWAAKYIATAADKGWISGYSDGKFHPDAKLTRGQAVTIINHMLGRTADKAALKKGDAKNFYDVFPDNWAYGNILEAATEHSHSAQSGGETWTSYTQDLDYPEESGWISDGISRYYLDADTRKVLRGKQTIDGKTYLLDDATGAAVTGFRSVDGWRRYYQNGLLMDDISGLGVAGAPYLIKVYKNSNYLIVYSKDSEGYFNTPVRAMRVSCGLGTPTGTYYTPCKYRWLEMLGGTYAQWCTQISGSYLFHSVPNWTKNNADLEVGEYNHLGDTRSAGCVRLNCRDAKWLYDNCPQWTKVVITTQESGGPLKKPEGLQIPSWHTWDPTDPTAQWRCEKRGCH